ncbi:MAG: ABC transporter permease subunit [Eubacterium sp.]
MIDITMNKKYCAEYIWKLWNYATACITVYCIFGLQTLGINIHGELASIIVFTFWGTAEMGDLVRSALISIPKHQYESGYGLGLKKIQVYVYIIFPQTIRRLLPSSINLLTRMIKTTSLVVLIGVVEVVKVGKQIIDASRYTEPNTYMGIWNNIFNVLYYMFSIFQIGISIKKETFGLGGIK